MASITPLTRQPIGRTFLVAAWALGVVGVAQFSAVGVAFFRSIQSSDGRVVPEQIDIDRLIAENPPPTEDKLSTDNPLDATPELDSSFKPRPLATTEPSPEPAPTTPPSAVPRPTPVPLSAFTPKVDPRMPELVEQGKLLRNNGDTAGALVKFREAAGLAPENPLPIAETAYTYEKMTLPDKAATEWRKVLQMGEKAGFYYSAAKSKLDIAVTAARTAVSGVSPEASASEVAELANGKSITIGRIANTEDRSAAGKRFSLSIPIHTKEGAVQNPRQDIVTHVRFYDQINGKEIVPTTANVAYRFAEPPADWRDGGKETLEVDYDLPQTGRDDPTGENRRFYGYIVRIYFKGTLQATSAEPASLTQKFPAPEKLRNTD